MVEEEDENQTNSNEYTHNNYSSVPVLIESPGEDDTTDSENDTTDSENENNGNGIITTESSIYKKKI